MKKIIGLLLSAFTLLQYSNAADHSWHAPLLKENYAVVNGMKLYYGTAGAGTPVVLLHGAFSTIEKDFGGIIPMLAKNHRVIGIELQGHGHTGDIDRALSYEAMADDVQQLLKSLNVSDADVIGYSLGGGVALQLAISHPGMIRHLVLLSTYFSPEGSNMGNPDSLKAKPYASLDASVWKKNYDRIAPDTAGGKKLQGKVFGLMGNWKGFSQQDIKRLKMPVMLLFGDGDISKPEHQVLMFRLLGGGNAGDLYELPNVRLAILPGTTHVTMVDQVNLLKPMIGSFLSAPATR